MSFFHYRFNIFTLSARRARHFILSTRAARMLRLAELRQRESLRHPDDAGVDTDSTENDDSLALSISPTWRDTPCEMECV